MAEFKEINQLIFKKECPKRKIKKFKLLLVHIKKDKMYRRMSVYIFLHPNNTPHLMHMAGDVLNKNRII